MSVNPCDFHLILIAGCSQFSRSSSGWGSRQLVALIKFKDPNSGFLVGDSCILEVEFRVLGLIKPVTDWHGAIRKCFLSSKTYFACRAVYIHIKVAIMFEIINSCKLFKYFITNPLLMACVICDLIYEINNSHILSNISFIKKKI